MSHINRTQIDRVADRIDAEVLLLLIPAPVQVCLPEQLRYFPRGADLSDADLTNANLNGARMENACVTADDEAFWKRLTEEGNTPRDHERLMGAWEIVAHSDKWGHPTYKFRTRSVRQSTPR